VYTIGIDENRQKTIVWCRKVIISWCLFHTDSDAPYHRHLDVTRVSIYDMVVRMSDGWGHEGVIDCPEEKEIKAWAFHERQIAAVNLFRQVI